MSRVNGNEIIVYKLVGETWTAIALTRSDEIMVDGEVIEIASSTSADHEWKRHIAGRKEWALVGDRIKIQIGARGGYSGASGGLTGFAIVKQAKVTMSRGSLANGSFAFIGDGALS